MVDFDEAYWSKVIGRPDWYMEFVPWAKKTQATLNEDTAEAQQFRKIIRTFFERMLLEEKVSLADNGPNLDEQRKHIDTVVIHHTSADPGYKLSHMNATQLLNVYAPYFLNPTDDRERSLKGKAVWSNHFREGKMSFLCYHWLMRMDGSFERLLEDGQIGWHAGNWDINCRSIAICLDNDYENKDPDEEILKKLAEFIKKTYPNIKQGQIIGHCEARQGTICPGTNFLEGWKKNILKYLGD